jgi:transcription antitermination factor NusG
MGLLLTDTLSQAILPYAGLEDDYSASQPEHAWFALHVRSRHEKIISATLRNKGYDAILPLYRRMHRTSNRFREAHLPVFPGYVFCRFDPADRLPILTTPGVVHIVGSGKTPVPVSQEEIFSIRTVMESGLEVQPAPFLHIGEHVVIQEGPLRGVEGILVDFKGLQELVISVTLLQRSLKILIGRQSVGPAQDGSTVVKSR